MMSVPQSLTEQSLYLAQICQDFEDSVACEDFLKTWWPSMAKCIYNEWMLTNLTCLYFGNCQAIWGEWICEDDSRHLAAALGDSDTLSVIPGAESFLHGQCFCGSGLNFEGHDCNSSVSNYVPLAMPAISKWVENKTYFMCSEPNNDGQQTCSTCRNRTGGI